MQHATRPSQGSASRKVQRNHVRVVPQRTPRCKKQSKKKVSSIHPSIYDQLCMQNHTMQTQCQLASPDMDCQGRPAAGPTRPMESNKEGHPNIEQGAPDPDGSDGQDLMLYG